MKPFHDSHGTRWLPVSHLAREFNKCPRTMRNWCDTGFILTLGYRTMRDCRGHWLVALVTSTASHSVPLGTGNIGTSL